MEENNKRDELIEQINEMALDEFKELDPGQKDDGCGDMLIVAGIGAGIAALIAAGIWLRKRHNRKKALKAAKDTPIDVEADEVDDFDDESDFEEPEKESKKKDK